MLAPLAALLIVSLPTDAPKAPPDLWFGQDKAEHFVAGAGLAGLGFGVARALKCKTVPSLLIGGGLALFVGAGKELLWDKALHRGDPSWKDFTWDTLGAGVGLGVTYLVIRFAGDQDHAAP